VEEAAQPKPENPLQAMGDWFKSSMGNLMGDAKKDKDAPASAPAAAEAVAEEPAVPEPVAAEPAEPVAAAEAPPATEEAAEPTEEAAAPATEAAVEVPTDAAAEAPATEATTEESSPEAPKKKSLIKRISGAFSPRATPEKKTDDAAEAATPAVEGEAVPMTEEVLALVEEVAVVESLEKPPAISPTINPDTIVIDTTPVTAGAA